MAHSTDTDTNHHIPPLQIDTETIAARMAALAETQPCPHCGLPGTEMVVDVGDLLTEVLRLYAALLTTRRQAANRLAAIRATLGAASDGEADPLEYLQDELAESSSGHIPSQVRGWWR
ncbi:MAG: hypothetical protein ACRDRV_12590 [Pseudonocardiaceae bacterium]